MDKRTTILIVDDSAANLQLCRGLLSNLYDVRLAKSGKMALDILERLKPGIILLDIEMPEMSGFEVMKEIRQKSKLKDIPVIFVTAHATEKLVTEAVQYGAADYLVKPFEASLLRAKIQTALLGGRGAPLIKY